MSVAELPKYKIDPSSALSAEEQSLRLHFKKNRPDVPDLEFPPYKFMPYPTAMYRDWEEKARQLAMRQLAAQLHADLSNPVEFQRVAAAMPEFESKLVGVNDYDERGDVIQALRDKNDADHRILFGQGWADTPDGVRAQKDKSNKALALSAAHRNYEDRNMGELAAVERDAADEAADDHVPEIKAKPVRRGRPAKKATEVN